MVRDDGGEGEGEAPMRVAMRCWGSGGAEGALRGVAAAQVAERVVR